MLQSRFVFLRIRKNVRFTNILRCHSSQTSPEFSEKGTPSVDSYKKYTDVGAAAPTSGKLPQREPLVKNFFIGKVDNELLAYPEVINREDMTKLRQECARIQASLEAFDDSAIDQSKSIPRDILKCVKDSRLYATNVPDTYDGRGWQWSQSLIASETEATLTDVAAGLLSHRVVIDTLNEIGTDHQKELFLPKLANGSLLATEAIFEYDESEDGFFNTTAQYDANDDVWILNGEKAFVINGPSAGLFLVIAQTTKLNVADDVGRTTTIFLVDKALPGVKVGDLHATIGWKGLSSSKIQFENVKVPSSCVVGQQNEGNMAAEIILRSSRLRSSIIGMILSKKCLNELTHHSIHCKQLGVALKDIESIKKHISDLMTSTYAMESMIYHTAGIFDEFEKQDVGMECALTKYYTLTRLRKNAAKSIDVIGPKSILPGQTTEVAFRNAMQLYAHGEPLDALKMYIALTGLQHAGIALNDTVKKTRNPLFHPGHIFTKFMESSSIDNPKSKLRLGESLHPSLEPAAQCIERSIARLHMAVELLLTKYGNTIIEKHMEVHRLAEMSAFIYSMFASTSRASRAYCIGLQLADHELLLALTICSEGEAKVKELTYEIFNGPFMNNDHNVNRLTKQVFKSGGYFCEHPLTYNF